jgi:hypothetical protein
LQKDGCGLVLEQLSRIGAHLVSEVVEDSNARSEDKMSSGSS